MSTTEPFNRIHAFFQHLLIPDSCHLGKRLFKKHFYEHSPLKAADKKAFVEDIENIEWRYTLKPSTINIPAFEDENHEYLEIAILQVQLTSGKCYKRIAEVMQKGIPYPLLIVFVQQDKAGEQFALSVADKRINRADSNKIVVEALHDTGWISLTQPKPWQLWFLADFHIMSFSYRNFYDFYQDMVKRVIALNCARHTGRYALDEVADRLKVDRLEGLRQIDQLQQEQAELRNKLKKEKNMGTQIQMNTRVKQIKDRIETIKQSL